MIFPRWLQSSLAGAFLVASAGAEPILVTAEKALDAVIERKEPVYPPMARRMGVEGVVEIEVAIGRDGEVLGVKRTDGHPVLGHAAIKAVEKWRFEPIRIDGKPAEVKARLTLEFTL